MTRKYSRAELRRLLIAAKLVISVREGAMSASDRLACRIWRRIPENERAFRETESLLLVASKLRIEDL